VRKGGLWAKHRGLKQGAIGNTLGEHIGNLLGTKENSKRSSPLSRLTPKLKRKKTRYFECMLSLLIGCMKVLFPKLFVTIFNLH
jgi:hypothetical protein